MLDKTKPKVWADLQGKERFMKCLLRPLCPAFLWSRSYFDPDAVFFQYQCGGVIPLPDGSYRRATWLDTSMTLSGQIGIPLIFQSNQIRIYPGDSDKLTLEIWKQKKWELRQLTAGLSAPKIGIEHVPDHDHLPLPEHNDFSEEERIAGHRISLVERCVQLMDLVNKNRLPCQAAEFEKTFHGNDLLMFRATCRELVPNEFSMYCVLLGTLWVTM